MTNKNKKTSWMLSAVIVLSFSLTNAILNIVIPPLLGGEKIFLGQEPAISSLFVYTLLILGTILLLISLIAFWLYKYFGDAYFDRYAVRRWGTFGFLFAVFIQIPFWIIGNRFPIFQFLIGIISLLLAFFIARKIFPLNKNI